MSSHDIPRTDPLVARSRAFVARFADSGPAFLSTHLPPQFIIGTPSGAHMMGRDQFIDAALNRAATVTGHGYPSPVLADVETIVLGDAYLLVTAHWAMPRLPDLDLVEDFLIDRTAPEWVCLAYLLRQDLPTLLEHASADRPLPT